MAIVELDVPPKVVAGLLLLILIPLGSILDGLTITLLTVPIMAPMITELGLSPIWFGILVIKAIEIGLLTPPVGINAFIIAGVARVPAERVYRALVPFIVLDLAVTFTLFMFPDIILFLPRMAGFAV